MALLSALGALKHASAGVRRAAVNVLPDTAECSSALLEGKLLNDSDSQVRMATLLALSEMPVSDIAGPAIYAMLLEPRNSEDRWIPDAATSAAARNDAAFLKAALASDKPLKTGVASGSLTNLLLNSSFEEWHGGKPVGWRVVNYSGRGGVDTGRNRT